MGWILLEAAVALTLFVAIVWWTMGSTRSRPKRPARRRMRPAAGSEPPMSP